MLDSNANPRHNIAMNEDDDIRPAKAKETGPVLFLSLFLLLLAFFILLNAISTFEETKSRMVITSLAATFRSEEIPDTSNEILVSKLEGEPTPELVVSELQRLWRTAVPVARVEILTPGNDILIELPVTQIFKSSEARIREVRRDLIEATAFALAARLEGRVVHMQATIRTEAMRGLEAVRAIDVEASRIEPGTNAGSGNGQLVDTDDPGAQFLPERVLEGFDLAFVRSTVFAERLVEGGTPPDNLEIGLSTGNPDRMALRFLVRDRNGTRVTFSQALRADSE